MEEAHRPRLGGRELNVSKLRRWEFGGSKARWRDLAESRLGRSEFDGSWLEWRELVGSKLGQRYLGGSRPRSIMQLQEVVRQGSEIVKIEGVWRLKIGVKGAERLQTLTKALLIWDGRSSSVRSSDRGTWRLHAAEHDV